MSKSKIKKFIILLLILVSFQEAYAKKIGIFLYTSEEEGNKIYEEFTRIHGFERKFNFRNKNYEYHATLGFIENVEDEDVKELKMQLKNALKINMTENTYFKFGVASLFGKNTNYIVALPTNPIDFLKLNIKINDIILEYKGGKYQMSDFTKRENYMPHLSLNAKMHQNVKLEALTETLVDLNSKMMNYNIALPKLVIKTER